MPPTSSARYPWGDSSWNSPWGDSSWNTLSEHDRLGDKATSNATMDQTQGASVERNTFGAQKRSAHDRTHDDGRREMTRALASRHILAIFVTALVGMLLATASPAPAQTDRELANLETRRAELNQQLTELDDQLAATRDEISLLATRKQVAATRIELLADDYEATVDAWQEPAGTRVQIALIGFTNGDPRQSALIDEVLALQGSDQGARARELYTAAIEDAQQRLEAVEVLLRELADQLGTARTGLASVQQLQAEAGEQLAQLERDRSELADEIDSISQRITYLRSLRTTAVLTGLPVEQVVNRPALAIKIDNVRPARPQSGLTQADIVFVEEVEGGLTRLAAVFHSLTPNEVGPVRSMRTSDFDLLAQLNSPLFANSGGNRTARRLLGESSLVDVGAATHGNLYYRTSRAAPHNLYTNPGNLWSVAQTEGYASGTPSALIGFRSESDTPAGEASPVNGVDINYGQTSVNYQWNGSGWERSQDRSATMDANGSRIAPTTVIVQFIDYTTSAADSRSPEAVTVGQGSAWFFNSGTVSQGTWRRGSTAETTSYFASDGSPMMVTPGQIWIELPRSGGAALR